MEPTLGVTGVARKHLFGARAARCRAVAFAACLLSAAATPRAAATGSDATYSFSGTIVDPQGKPVAGAKVWFDYALDRPPAQPAPADAVSDADGKFQFSTPKSGLSEMLASPYPTAGVLVATKEGFGFAAGPADPFEATGRLAADRLKVGRRGSTQAQRDAAHKDSILKLVPDDVPLQGEITNANGDPVAGATVELLAVWSGEKGALDAWAADMKKQRQVWRNVSLLFYRYDGPGVLAYLNARLWFGVESPLREMRAVPITPVKSDARGRFTLKGIGRERLVEVLVRGEGLATVHKFARTRAGEVVEMRNPFGHRTGEIAPSTCTFELAPSVPIEGQVFEAKTARALGGVRVVSTSALTVGTVTDAQGHYRLEGVPLGNPILVVVPPSGTRHVPVDVNVWAGAGVAVLRRDIVVPAGVVVRGRAIDERTHKPVEGSLSYFACETNPELRKAQGLSSRRRVQDAQTDAEGRFAIPVLAGPGILAFRAGSQFHFGVGADQIKCRTLEMAGSGGGKVFQTVPSPCRADSYNLLVPIDPGTEAREMAVDLQLRSGVEVTARVRTIDGKPLGMYYVLGAGDESYWREQSEDRFTVVGCYPEETRRLFLYQPARNLVASAEVTGVPPEPIEIRLRPGASVVGRFLDADGRPIEGAPLVNNSMPLRAVVGHLAELKRDRGLVPIVPPYVTTNEQGRFEIKGLVPGLKYSAQLLLARRMANARGAQYYETVRIFTDVRLKSGETKDVGDVRAKPPEPRRRLGPAVPAS